MTYVLPQPRLSSIARFILLGLLLILGYSLHAQVGIGATDPKAFFNVSRGRTVLFGDDTLDVDVISRKLIWYGSKGAFRIGGIIAGFTNPTAWKNENIGTFSFASGINTLASANYTTSIGIQNTSSAEGAISIGTNCIASGTYSTAMGSNVSTNNKQNSFIIGSAGIVYNNSANSQMMMSFGGGYVLYTTNSTNQSAAVGVQVAAGGNAWTTISDSTRKENFRATNGADFLQKIAKMRLGSWNYKGQDAKVYRHYGPMAQDFFAAFGRDELGVIGEDKSINQADFDGVNLIAIQALIKKVEKLEDENNKLKQQLQAEQNGTASLKLDVEQIKKQLALLLKQE